MQGKAPVIYVTVNKLDVFFYRRLFKLFNTNVRSKKFNKQTINIGRRRICYNKKIAEICSNLTGVNNLYIKKIDRKIRMLLAQNKQELLNYKTTVSLKEGIKKTYDYIKKETRPFDYNIKIEIDNELTPTTWKNKEI